MKLNPSTIKYGKFCVNEFETRANDNVAEIEK